MMILTGPRVGRSYNVPKHVEYMETYDNGYDPILKIIRMYVLKYYRTKNGWELYSWRKY